MDPATVLGYAHSTGIYGSWTNRGQGLGQQLRFLERWLFEFHETRATIRHVAYEDSFSGAINVNTRKYHGAIRGIIQAVCADIGATWQEIQPSSLKKQACGRAFVDDGFQIVKGKKRRKRRMVSKTEVIQATIEKFGITPDNDNVADAIWILFMARQGFERAGGALKTKKPRRRRKPEKPASPDLPF